MKNEELKKKIAQIISEYCCPSGKTHKQLYGAERQCYTEMNFAECKPITECTDALIAAGIGDVSELKKHRVVVEKSPVPTDDNCYILPNTSPIIKQLYSGKEVEQIAKERDEYKHRAERAERALLLACANVVKDEKDDVDIELLVRVVYDKYLKQAEQLAEERKDEQS